MRASRLRLLEGTPLLWHAMTVMKRQRLIGLFLFGFVFLNSPVLTIFNREVVIGGVPLVYVYLFAVWALLIVLTGWIVEQVPERKQMVSRREDRS